MFNAKCKMMKYHPHFSFCIEHFPPFFSVFSVLLCVLCVLLQGWDTENTEETQSTQRKNFEISSVVEWEVCSLRGVHS